MYRDVLAVRATMPLAVKAAGASSFVQLVLYQKTTSRREFAVPPKAAPQRMWLIDL
jgi:hypothetical protein